MTINGYEVEIDFTDADTIEKIEQGVDKLQKDAEQLELQRKDEKITSAEGIRLECKILKGFFDYVFGDGTSEKIFNGKDSLDLCLKAYEDIIKAKETQCDDLYQRLSTYSPDRLKR